MVLCWSRMILFFFDTTTHTTTKMTKRKTSNSKIIAPSTDVAMMNMLLEAIAGMGWVVPVGLVVPVDWVAVGWIVAVDWETIPNWQNNYNNHWFSVCIICIYKNFYILYYVLSHNHEYNIHFVYLQILPHWSERRLRSLQLPYHWYHCQQNSCTCSCPPSQCYTSAG